VLDIDDEEVAIRSKRVEHNGDEGCMSLDLRRRRRQQGSGGGKLLCLL
jgi:hypothetical protein